MFNEVATMMIAKADEGILKCFECYDYKNRLWIFMEHMDGGSLTSMVEKLKGVISENVCKYICFKVL